jgi:hypothetical protein
MKFVNLGVGITASFSFLVDGANAKVSSSSKSNAKVNGSNQKARLERDFMMAMSGDDSQARKLKAGSVGNAKRRDKMYEKLLGSARKLEQEGQYGENQASDAYFDMTTFAFKYAGCAAIREYDEQYAQNGTPFTQANYAVFRLCPGDSCNKYSMTGCGKNYGEYVVEMSTYLEAIMGYYTGRYDEFCDYCQPCVYEYDDDQKEVYNEALQDCYDTIEEEGWEEYDEEQQQAWEDYYNNNNGDMEGYNNGNYYDNGNTDENNDNNGRRLRRMQDSNYTAGSSKAGYWGADGTWYDYDSSYYSQNQNADDECLEKMQEEFGICDSYVCGDYLTYCTDYYGDAASAQAENIDMANFIECTKFENSRGQTYYLGPHCGSNHFTIAIGVFSDANCANYIGADVQLSTVLGYNVDDDFYYFPKECIYCDGTVS